VKGRFEEAIALQKTVFETGSERWKAVGYAQLAQWYAFTDDLDLAAKNADLGLAKTDKN
jgi:hypothetical protein